MSRPVALITGGSRGIGRAIADALAPDHHVLIGGRDAEAVARVVAELPSASPFVADLTDEASVNAACAGLDQVDVLVHSAGTFQVGTVADVPAELWSEQLAVNVVAPARLTRALLPALRARHGLVVFLNSGAGFTTFPGVTVYSASKFALRALAEGLRAEERGAIRVTSIHPGQVDTDMQRLIQAERGNPYQPERYLTAKSVADTVRLAVDAPANASIDTLSIRPA